MYDISIVVCVSNQAFSRLRHSSMQPTDCEILLEEFEIALSSTLFFFDPRLVSCPYATYYGKGSAVFFRCM